MDVAHPEVSFLNNGGLVLALEIYAALLSRQPGRHLISPDMAAKEYKIFLISRDGVESKVAVSVADEYDWKYLIDIEPDSVPGAVAEPYLREANFLVYGVTDIPPAQARDMQAMAAEIEKIAAKHGFAGDVTAEYRARVTAIGVPFDEVPCYIDTAIVALRDIKEFIAPQEAP